MLGQPLSCGTLDPWLTARNSPYEFAVIDVHQSWSGPCKAIQSTFKRIFFDYGDKPMKFFTADASKIEALSDLVGSCEPAFVFYMDGAKFGDTIKGVNAPSILKVIFEKLEIDEKI